MLTNAKLQAIVCSSNLVEARRFYGEVLQLPSKGSSVGAEVFDVGGVALRVSPVPASTPSEHTVLGFAVPDVIAVAEWLHAKGVQFERFPSFSHDALGI